MARFKTEEKRIAECFLRLKPLNEIKSVYNKHGAQKAAQILDMDPVIILNALSIKKVHVRRTLFVNKRLKAAIEEQLPGNKILFAREHYFDMLGEDHQALRDRIYNEELIPTAYPEDDLYFAYQFYTVYNSKKGINDITVYHLTQDDIYNKKGKFNIPYESYGDIYSWDYILTHHEDVVYY